MNIEHMNTERLAEAWLAAKAAEHEAIENRRQIEDMLNLALGYHEADEGTKTEEAGAFKIKMTCRLNKTINGDLLQEIASRAGITEQLSTLFRWKPEINAAAWKTAPTEIKNRLAPAITVKAGRPSYSIEQE